MLVTLLVVFAAAVSSTTAANRDDGWQTVTPALDARKILRHGPQGLAYEIEELLPASHLPEWGRRSCSVIYWRLDWTEVCDADGRPKFEQLDREIFAAYRALFLGNALESVTAEVRDWSPE